MRRFAAASLVSLALVATAPTAAAATPQPDVLTAEVATTLVATPPAETPLASMQASRQRQQHAARLRRTAKQLRRAHGRSAAKVRRCSPAGIRSLRGTGRSERRIRCIINVRRVRAGLRPLRYDRCLDRSAERHGRDMVARHYFAHVSRDGRDLSQRARAAGYFARAGSWTLGENLAWGGGRAAARGAVRGWLRSPPHRRNIFSPRFRDIGVAVVRGAPVRGRAASRAAHPATFVVAFGVRAPGRCGR